MKSTIARAITSDPEPFLRLPVFVEPPAEPHIVLERVGPGIDADQGGCYYKPEDGRRLWIGPEAFQALGGAPERLFTVPTAQASDESLAT